VIDLHVAIRSQSSRYETGNAIRGAPTYAEAARRSTRTPLEMPRMTKLDGLIAQIGLSSEQRDFSVSLLLTGDELGESWSAVADRSWRVGGPGLRSRRSRTAEGNRAREAGTVTAWRSFESPTSRRWMWIQVAPMASSEDAEAYSLKIEDQFVPDPRAPNAPRRLDMVNIEDLSGARGWQHTSSSTEFNGIARAVSGCVGRVVLLMQCSWDGDSWSAEKADSMVTLQTEKIRRMLAAEDKSGKLG
jgi:hypothetical protein